jgi:hypothetical protein
MRRTGASEASPTPWRARGQYPRNGRAAKVAPGAAQRTTRGRPRRPSKPGVPAAAAEHLDPQPSVGPESTARTSTVRSLRCEATPREPCPERSVAVDAVRPMEMLAFESSPSIPNRRIARGARTSGGPIRARRNADERFKGRIRSPITPEVTRAHLKNAATGCRCIRGGGSRGSSPGDARSA